MLCLVGVQNVGCSGVGVAVDSDGGYPHALGGSDEADGDLAAIGNQEFADHAWR